MQKKFRGRFVSIDKLQEISQILQGRLNIEINK